MDGYIDIFCIDFHCMAILDLQYIGYPVNVYFLLQIFDGNWYLDSLDLFLDRGRVRDGKIIDSLDDGVTVVGDQFVDELRLGSQHYFRLVCALCG